MAFTGATSRDAGSLCGVREQPDVWRREAVYSAREVARGGTAPATIWAAAI